MGKELHIGAGLLVLAATCGRLAMKNGDVVVRQSDMLVGGARHLDGVGSTSSLRHLDGLRHGDELRHVESPIDDLLSDLASESAQLTAEHLLDWADELGEAEDDDLTGLWRLKGDVPDTTVQFERTCARDLQGTTYGVRCSELGVRDDREVYRARWSGQQAIGSQGVCTLIEQVHEARIAVEGEEAAAIAAHLRPLLDNDVPCAPPSSLGTR